MPHPNYKILFICSGNSCRSPMAEGIARAISERECLRFEFYSAGTLGIDNAPATPEAIVSAKEFGADISKHLSRALSQDLVDWADIVIGMEYAHLESVRLFDIKNKKVRLLGFREIDDPIGQNPEFYLRTAHEIADCLEMLLTELKDEA